MPTSKAIPMVRTIPANKAIPADRIIPAIKDIMADRAVGTPADTDIATNMGITDLMSKQCTTQKYKLYLEEIFNCFLKYLLSSVVFIYNYLCI